jgi:hypothetical protein
MVNNPAAAISRENGIQRVVGQIDQHREGRTVDFGESLGPQIFRGHSRFCQHVQGFLGDIAQGIDAGRTDSHGAREKLSGQGFGHDAAARIAQADEEDTVCHGCFVPMKFSGAIDSILETWATDSIIIINQKKLGWEAKVHLFLI